MSFADADAVARCSCRLPVSLTGVDQSAKEQRGEIGFLAFSLSRRMAEHCVAACVQMIQFLITAGQSTIFS
jgi:hypothetical protein